MDCSGTANKEEATGLLEKQYEKISANVKDASLEEAIGGCVMPLLQSYLDAGKKDQAKAFVARVKKDFASSEQAEEIGKAHGVGTLIENRAGGGTVIANENRSRHSSDATRVQVRRCNRRHTNCPDATTNIKPH